ncbi:MAG: hypothetical protein LBV30_07865 [Propionibacteriaceae bacterium]|jgi:hypothetical protein|nr:hypothetical protein [Propionibacteriaceae bacterium]
MTASRGDLILQALTGQACPLGQSDCLRQAMTAEQILEALAGIGWTADELRNHAIQCWQSDQVWPHPIDPAQLHTLGAACWLALLAEVRQRLHLDHVTNLPSRRQLLNADERRLLAEVPPHFGHAG